MSSKKSFEIKTGTVKQKQKNGDTYILERKTLYIPELKFNKVLSSHLVAKIPKGETEPVPTRPKRPSKAKEIEPEVKHDTELEATGNGQAPVCSQQELAPSQECVHLGEGTVNEDSAFVEPGSAPHVVEASRQKTGMMDILEHIGRVSGIDEAIMNTCDTGTAQKIISLARYLLGTNGQSFPGIMLWQYSHPLPYREGISEDIYHDLFVTLGKDERIQQSFFQSRCAGLAYPPVIAYDSTTISTDSECLPEARYGFNKAGDGKKTVKLLTLYSIDARRPIAFTKQPGNLSDVASIKNALNQLQALGLGNAEIVTDNGYYSEENLAEMLHEHFGFITLVKTSVKWVKTEIDEHIADLQKTSSVCPFDTSTRGVTIKLSRSFTYTRKYASVAKSIPAGTPEKFTRRLYLHIYFNPFRRVEQDVELDRDLLELKAYIESGKGLEMLNDSSQNMVKKYLHIRHSNGKTVVQFNEKAIADKKKRNGYFALVSNSERDTFECLRKYRKRGLIESFFESEKQRADGSRTRVWGTDALRGRMFVQFVALCYYEHLHNIITDLKKELGKPTGNPVHDTEKNLALEDKLKSWLNNTPLYLVLQWFDTVESVNVSSQLRRKRWNTETTQRDNLFLQRIGMKG